MGHKRTRSVYNLCNSNMHRGVFFANESFSNDSKGNFELRMCVGLKDLRRIEEFSQRDHPVDHPNQLRLDPNQLLLSSAIKEIYISL